LDKPFEGANTSETSSHHATAMYRQLSRKCSLKAGTNILQLIENICYINGISPEKGSFRASASTAEVRGKTVLEMLRMRYNPWLTENVRL
jgi:hypothetical protein